MNSAMDFISPGEAIKFYLDRNDWTQEDFAQIMSISTKHANELIKNKKPLSLELILDISKVFSFSDEQLQDFIKLYSQYRMKNIKEDMTIAEKAKLYADIPVSEMIKKGWIERTNDFSGLINQLKKVLNLSANNSKGLIEEIKGFTGALHYRKSENSNFNNINAVIWKMVAESYANAIEVPQYNEQALEQLLQNLHLYTIKENGVEIFLEDLLQTGVRFINLEHLIKTYLDGAAFWSNNNPIIALTTRYDRLDNFWFTIAHEIAHVLKHLRTSKDIFFIDDNFSKSETDKFENEANDIANAALKRDLILEWFREFYGYIPKEEVIKCSQHLKVHPSNIVAILAFNEKTSWATLHRFKDTVKSKIPEKFKVCN